MGWWGRRRGGKRAQALRRAGGGQSLRKGTQGPGAALARGVGSPCCTVARCDAAQLPAGPLSRRPHSPPPAVQGFQGAEADHQDPGAPGQQRGDGGCLPPPARLLWRRDAQRGREEDQLCARLCVGPGHGLAPAPGTHSGAGVGGGERQGPSWWARPGTPPAHAPALCRQPPPLPCLPPPLQDFYSLTLDSMAEAKNERLWFKTNMKLANLWVSLKEAGKAAKVRRPG